MLLTWGTKVLGGDLIARDCPSCGAEKARVHFTYKYFGLFWMGFAHSKAWVVQCTECDAAYELDRSAMPDTSQLISWNYQWGWAVWAALIVFSMVSGG